MQDTINNKPQAWVGCLGCYNNGALNGLWVDGVDAADTDGAGLSEAGKCLKCGADEFWVMDYEGYGDILGGECSPLEAANVAAAIEKIEDGGHDIEAITAYASNLSLSLENWDEWKEAFEGSYIGEYDTLKDYAEQYVQETGLLQNIPEEVARFFDYEAYAHELSFDMWQEGKMLFWDN
jgi:antirestriction protein